MYSASTANGPQENQAVWQGTKNKNAGDKVEMPSCAFGDAAGLRRNRTPVLACVWMGVGEYEPRIVGQILSFLAIFPLYARLISNVWIV